MCTPAFRDGSHVPQQALRLEENKQLLMTWQHSFPSDLGGPLFSILVIFLDCICHMRLIDPVCLVSAFEMEIEFHLKLT